MEIILSILVYIGVLVTNVYYPKDYVDNQIQTHRPEIEAIQSNPEQMKQVKMYSIKIDETGRVLVFDGDAIEN